jgi:hypothetical protein
LTFRFQRKLVAPLPEDAAGALVGQGDQREVAELLLDQFDLDDIVAPCALRQIGELRRNLISLQDALQDAGLRLPMRTPSAEAAAVTLRA